MVSIFELLFKKAIMKKMKTIYRILLLLPFTFMLGCNDFLDVNQSPNNPEVVPPSVLLPTGLVGSAFANANELNRFASTVMDYTYGASGNPANYDVYITDGSNFGNQWRFEIYAGALIAYQKLIENAGDKGATAYVGIAKIMKAYTFSIATDVWGDVPYSQALKGSTYPQPRLDKQEDIYKGNTSLEIQSLFDLIREGIADLNATSTILPGTDDVVYNGGASGIANWKRAGYTLMLRLALQMSDREPALAASIINEVITADNYIKTNAQNLSVKFGAATGSQSPVYTWTNVSSFLGDMNVSTGYVNLLQGTVAPLTGVADPRLDLFVTKPTGSFITYANGFAGTLAPVANRSRWNTAVTGANGVGPIRLITNAQRAFMLAEAALTIPGVNLPAGQTANSLYREGITASMTEAGVAAGAMSTYLASAAGNLSGTVAQQREQIILQKYIAMTGNGLEAWNDFRRTGYPNFPEHQNAVGVDGKRPKRAQYINEEVQRNPNFSPIVLSNVNVWWDVN